MESTTYEIVIPMFVWIILSILVLYKFKKELSKFIRFILLITILVMLFFNSFHIRDIIWEWIYNF